VSEPALAVAETENVHVPPTVVDWFVGCVLIVGATDASAITQATAPKFVEAAVSVCEYEPVAPAATLSFVENAASAKPPPEKCSATAAANPVIVEYVMVVDVFVSAATTTTRSSPAAAVPPAKENVAGEPLTESVTVFVRNVRASERPDHVIRMAHWFAVLTSLPKLYDAAGELGAPPSIEKIATAWPSTADNAALSSFVHPAGPVMVAV